MNLTLFDPMNLKTLSQIIHLSPPAYAILQTCIRDYRLDRMQYYLSNV